MTRRTIRLIILIYLLIGLYVAFAKDAITERFIRQFVGIILIIILWPLALLGVDVTP